jgi:hemolysin III
MTTGDSTTSNEYGPGEELANSLTHGLGVVLGLAALAWMVTLAALHGTARDVVGAALFGSTLVLLYTMSTLYHAVRGPRVKRVFRILDHTAIYLLIAGTYTPFCLVTLRGAWGWSLFGVVWGMALLGTVFKFLFIQRFPALSTAVYLVMGWLVFIAAGPLWRALPAMGWVWLLGGGAFYSLGVVFYAWHRLRYHHAVWHLFVLAGSLCHVAAVLGFVIPGARG